MWKHRWSVCVIALCLQCGGSTTPAEEPASPTESPEAPAAAPAGEETPSEAPAPEEEKSGDKADEKAAPAKKGCAGLPKNDCKVTVGCAWNDLKKCVEEGPAE